MRVTTDNQINTKQRVLNCTAKGARKLRRCKERRFSVTSRTYRYYVTSFVKMIMMIINTHSLSTKIIRVFRWILIRGHSSTAAVIYYTEVTTRCRLAAKQLKYLSKLSLFLNMAAEFYFRDLCSVVLKQ